MHLEAVLRDSYAWAFVGFLLPQQSNTKQVKEPTPVPGISFACLVWTHNVSQGLWRSFLLSAHCIFHQNECIPMSSALPPLYPHQGSHPFLSCVYWHLSFNVATTMYKLARLHDSAQVLKSRWTKLWGWRWSYVFLSQILLGYISRCCATGFPNSLYQPWFPLACHQSPCMKIISTAIKSIRNPPPK